MDYKKLYQDIVEEMVFRMDRLESDTAEFDKKGMEDSKKRIKARLDEMRRLKGFIDSRVFLMQEQSDNR